MIFYNTQEEFIMIYLECFLITKIICILNTNGESVYVQWSKAQEKLNFKKLYIAPIL